MIPLGAALDRTTLDATPRRAVLDPDGLTRHAVCVGMTGSGKTGLCIGLLEALSDAGVPILAIDPKGDLTNLALLLDPERPAEFEPWVDAGEAERRAISRPALAAEQAERWGRALAAEGLGSEAIAERLRKVKVIVHTPGSESGVPIDVLTALGRAPEGLGEDAEGLREYVIGAVSALLGLIGRAVDPLTDPGAILLSRILSDAFAAGEPMPLDVLLPRIVDPPFETLGYFSVDEVIGREARTDLAVALNSVAASPAFRAWLAGVPLDIGGWLAPTEDGRVPLRVLSLAHLDDRQRQFCVTMILHAVVAWSRSLPGTSRLRALLYFDEVMGYLPPHPKNPPTKAPVLTLLKQARAVGVGVMLCTQNPVDVDYKALSNAATWFVGRLQTKNDRERVLEGLRGAGDDATAELDDLLSKLPPRAFVWRSAEVAEPRVFRTRQVLSYLRGPLTRREIATLAQEWTRHALRADGLLGEPPPQPPEVPVRWLLPEGLAALGLEDTGAWRATLYARLRVKHDTGDRVVHRWLREVDGEPVATALEDPWLAKRPPAEGRYHPVPSGFVSPVTRKRLVEDVVASEPIDLVGGARGLPDARDVSLLAWAVVWAPTRDRAPGGRLQE